MCPKKRTKKEIHVYVVHFIDNNTGNRIKKYIHATSLERAYITWFNIFGSRKELEVTSIIKRGGKKGIYEDEILRS